jgi:hypothetical protein
MVANVMEKKNSGLNHKIIRCDDVNCTLQE